MAKVVTLRLDENDYKKILTASWMERRPISNFITTTVLKEIEESYFVDAVETAQIKSDKNLLKKLEEGHADAKNKKGKLIG